jgi:hypothetical protein
MKRTMRISGAAFAVLFAAVLTAGCSTSVSALRGDPARYVGRTLSISGEVGRVIPIPFTEYSVYMLEDRSGSIPVFSNRERESGSRVMIRAEVVGYADTGDEREAERAAKSVREFLVKHELAGEESARRIADGIIGTVSRLQTALEGTYFLIEQ